MRAAALLGAAVAAVAGLAAPATGVAQVPSETCHRVASPTGAITTVQGLVNALSPGETGCLTGGVTYLGDVTLNKADVHLRTHPADPMATIQGRLLITGSYSSVSHVKLDGRNAANLASPTVAANDVDIRYTDIQNVDSAASCVVGDLRGSSPSARLTLYANRIHDCGSASSGTLESAVNAKQLQESWITGNVIFDNADRGLSFESNASWTWNSYNTIDGNGHGVVYGGASTGNELSGALVTNSQAGWNASRASLTGTSNSLEACVRASNPNSAFNTNGGVETGLSSQIALTSTVADPLYVNRAAKNFSLQASTPCAGKGADAHTASDAPRTSLNGRPVAAAGNITFKLGSTKPSSTFECRFDYAGGTGTWAACSTTKTYGPVTDGTGYTFKARATAGGLVGPERSYTSTVDSAPPDTAITAGPTGHTNNNDPQFQFSGTGNGSGLEYECRLTAPGATPGGWDACNVWCEQVEGYCDYPARKAYSNLADGGSYTFEVRALDPAGNADPTPATRLFTVDTVAPDTQITSGSFQSQGNPTYGFTSEANATFQCKLDGPGAALGSWAACGPSSQSYSNLAEGTYTFRVMATDQAGNADPVPATRTTVVDRTPPDTTLTGGPQGETAATTAQFTFTSAETSFECKLDQGSWTTCSSGQSYSGLQSGAHTFDVRAKDPAGNVDPSPATRTWEVVACNATADPATPAVDTPDELVALLSANQTGCFKPGTYTTTTANKETRITANGVTLRRYPGTTGVAAWRGRVVIDGSGVTIRGLKLEGSYGRDCTGSSSCTVPFSSSMPSPTINGANAKLVDNEITNQDTTTRADGWKRGGICVTPTGSGDPSGYVIERNRIHNCGRQPPPGTAPTSHDHGIYLDHGTGTVRHNVIYDNADRGIKTGPDPIGAQIYRNTIDGNGWGINWSSNAADNIANENVVSNSYWRFNLEPYQIILANRPPSTTANEANNTCLQAGNPRGAWYNANGGISSDPNFPDYVVLGAHTIVAPGDPLYVNRAAKDYRLVTGSLCGTKGAPDDVAQRQGPG